MTLLAIFYLTIILFVVGLLAYCFFNIFIELFPFILIGALVVFGFYIFVDTVDPETGEVVTTKQKMDGIVDSLEAFEEKMERKFGEVEEVLDGEAVE